MDESVYRQTRRNGNAATCQTCGAKIAPKRGSRRQLFCSRRCKKRAYSDLKLSAATPPADGGRSVQNSLVISKPCKAENRGRGSAISAPREVIRAEVLSAHEWHPMTGSDGAVRGWIAYLRPRALVSP